MYQSQRIVALIPARGGSKRLPRKNVLPLRGFPLIAWSIAAAKNCPLIDEVVVSTDDAEIAEIATLAGAKILDRPPGLALDQTPSLPVFQDALQRIMPQTDVLVVLQPTTPFRRNMDIMAGIMNLVDADADAVIAVSKAKMGPEWLLEIEHGFLKMPTANTMTHTRTQDQSLRFQINGALYVFRPGTVMTAERYAWGPRTLPLILERPWDIDIDDLNDFRIANAIAHEFDFHCR
jgi:CMP-N,N'-diacetyllegionaminic acid synthase